VNVAAKLAAVGTAAIGESWRNARIMRSPPEPVAPNMSMAGFAYTVCCLPGDNLAIHHAIAAAAKDSAALLVVDYGKNVSSGPFGEIMALACKQRGIRGLLISGAIRDSQQISHLDFPVFALGKNITGTTKNDLGQHNCAVNIGDVWINPGDMVIADADGIVVVDASEVTHALESAEARVSKEAVVIERLISGETTLQIYNLDGQGS
jgi:4-hydroxy-4-methyl-2-oxoglutarate aldolase